MEIIWLFVFVAVVVTVIVFVVRAQRATLARYSAWASQRGWTFTRRDDTHAARWDVLPFTIGRQRRAWDVFTGTADGRPVTAFRLELRTPGAESRADYKLSVLSLGLPAALPRVLIAPQRSPERIIFQGAVGKDYEVEWGEFNREWWIRTDDPRFTSDFIHPQMMERLMEPDARGLHLRIEGDDLIGWFHGVRDLVPMLETQLPVLLDVARLIPGFVWKERGHAPRPR